MNKAFRAIVEKSDNCEYAISHSDKKRIVINFTLFPKSIVVSFVLITSHSQTQSPWVPKERYNLSYKFFQSIFCDLFLILLRWILSMLRSFGGELIYAFKRNVLYLNQKICNDSSWANKILLAQFCSFRRFHSWIDIAREIAIATQIRWIQIVYSVLFDCVGYYLRTIFAFIQSNSRRKVITFHNRLYLILILSPT